MIAGNDGGRPLRFHPKVDCEMFATLWIGECEADYVRDAVAALRRMGPVIVERGESAAADFEEATAFTLIVIVERFPGEWSSLRFETLRRRYPALPIVRLCGPWCDGELRSRVPPPAFRVPWHRAATFFTRESARLARGECPLWGRPVTETEEERSAIETQNASTNYANLKVGIASDRPAIAIWLLDAVRTLGAASVSIVDRAALSESEIDLFLCDLAFECEPAASCPENSMPAATVTRCPKRCVAVVDFFRPEQFDKLSRRGFASVLAKPFSLDDLTEALNSC